MIANVSSCDNGQLPSIFCLPLPEKESLSMTKRAQFAEKGNCRRSWERRRVHLLMTFGLWVDKIPAAEK